MTNYHPEYKPACKLANARIAELEAMLQVAWSDIDDDFPDVVSEGDYAGWIEDLRRRAGKEVTR